MAGPFDSDLIVEVEAAVDVLAYEFVDDDAVVDALDRLAFEK